MRTEIVTPAVNKPITLADVKLYGNFNGTTRDAEITAFIDPAISYVERYTGRKLITQVWEIFYDSWEYRDIMPLSTFNIQTIDSFETINASDTASVIPASSYRLSSDRVIFDNGRTGNFDLRNYDGVKITVTTGFGLLQADVPPQLQTALSMIITSWMRYNGKLSDSDLHNIPDNLKAMLFPYKNFQNAIL